MATAPESFNFQVTTRSTSGIDRSKARLVHLANELPTPAAGKNAGNLAKVNGFTAKDGPHFDTDSRNRFAAKLHVWKHCERHSSGQNRFDTLLAFSLPGWLCGPAQTPLEPRQMKAFAANL